MPNKSVLVWLVFQFGQSEMLPSFWVDYVCGVIFPLSFFNIGQKKAWRMYFKPTLHLKELNDFLTGFASWQKDITAKDRQLIQSAKENQV